MKYDIHPVHQKLFLITVVIFVIVMRLVPKCVSHIGMVCFYWQVISRLSVTIWWTLITCCCAVWIGSIQTHSLAIAEISW